ncbi:PREDICTED: receptor-like protein kinase FERONIA [Populus euphratica]|uniref:Receptor-like protein kinase FERONIA n=1 Tax=Populus euphratica TaxID=75702 RepID=A0AAJ6TEF1_POPEU|nr:PREDICTED: receptor-like protein kinase FERONIA [Populus euphratica]
MSSSSDKYLSLSNLSLFTPLHLSFLFLHLTILVTGDSPPPYDPVDSIALDCGSSSQSFVSGRQWTADINSKVALLDQDSPSSNSTANGASTSSVPYHTARVSHSQFTYTFPVKTTGPKYVRLYFNPASYTGFNRSKASFSVTAGRYTFLSNFSGIHYTDPLGERGYAREFILNVEGEQKNLSVAFTPSPHVAGAYAFINGIEIVSMPTNLYYTTAGDPGLHYVDKDFHSPLQKETALELMYRINVAANYIEPNKDSGMFRSWLNDVDYLTDARPSVYQYNGTIQLQYNNLTRYAAPDALYRTARTMGNDTTVNKEYNMTWEFPVQSTFTYFVRLHFCQFIPIISREGDLIFQIYIANQTAELYADIISWADGNGVPIYKDYGVMMHAGGIEEVQNLSIALHPSPQSFSFPDAMLNGVEIFKLSKSDNLSGPNPGVLMDSPISNTPPSATSTKPKHSRRGIGTIIGAAVSGFVVVSFLFFLIFWRRVQKLKDWVSGDGASKLSPLVSWPTKSIETQRSSLPSDLCHHFSLAEIIAATNNFDDSFIIGAGGFGNVYKGLFDGGVNRAAIKRLNPSSRQGATEFRTEIEMLSQLRFRHLVSLIGYCNDNNEMILVYDFMARGTLRDHLYRTDNPPLSWTQRLEICIGAARGLHYLHTGAKHTVIHRDVKTTNILLDEKWVAKVSDFGLSKTGPTSTSKGHVSTVVKGSIGYLDPEYCQRQQLTEKSDVYSFGVVLFEVLCARPAINRSAVPASLAELARQSHSNGTINEIIDPYLDGKISPDCLKNFVDVAVRCLLENGIERPSMTDVVWGLEFALQLQESAEEYVKGAQTEKEVDMESPLKGYSIDDSSNLFSTGSELVVNSRILEMATTSSSDGQSFLSNDSEKMMSGAVFSEIMNPKGR